jgi:monofunctional biosynthetic peptidoglycan transglycosylase
LSLPEVESLINNNPKTTALIEQRKKEALSEGKKLRVRQNWVSFDHIPKLLKRTIRISEDANFYFHQGVDMEELEESIKKNWEKGEFARGASTITQQLAKNLYLSTEKSLWRKFKEYFISRELESTLSKNRIFHLYLNIIEYGRGIFGVDAAARYYFGKTVSQLNDEEIIRLTAVIPKPLKVKPNQNSKWLLWRCRWITEKLLLYKYIEPSHQDSLMILFTPDES